MNFWIILLILLPLISGNEWVPSGFLGRCGSTVCKTDEICLRPKMRIEPELCWPNWLPINNLNLLKECAKIRFSSTLPPFQITAASSPTPTLPQRKPTEIFWPIIALWIGTVWVIGILFILSQMRNKKEIARLERQSKSAIGLDKVEPVVVQEQHNPAFDPTNRDIYFEDIPL
ncbi:hypothetical protein DdX_16855 [Ditylenchus destructor]|uniref:Uncharacterized protein n=1 Tax=Ditylenchus destructor TaxID=166010 RepID=A0AAD4MSH4_9BILA|nr:hypothetical protein DdX_16855 [Ditylenchus destructor]